jgi:hypothetical protein
MKKGFPRSKTATINDQRKEREEVFRAGADDAMLGEGDYYLSILHPLHGYIP